MLVFSLFPSCLHASENMCQPSERPDGSLCQKLLWQAALTKKQNTTFSSEQSLVLKHNPSLQDLSDTRPRREKAGNGPPSSPDLWITPHPLLWIFPLIACLCVWQAICAAVQFFTGVKGSVWGAGFNYAWAPAPGRVQNQARGDGRGKKA